MDRATPWAERQGLLLKGVLFASLMASASAPAAGLPPVEEPILSLIRGWFALLASHPSGSLPEARLLEPRFEVSLDGAAEGGSSDVRAWLADLRSDYPRVEFQIGELRITPLEPGLYRARFELDRQAFASDGTPHVARWEQIWLVRSDSSGAPTILRIQQRRALPFPGTGPRIICN